MDKSPLAITAQEVANGTLSPGHSITSSSYVPVSTASLFPSSSFSSSSSSTSSVSFSSSSVHSSVLSEAETMHIQHLIGKPVPVHRSGSAFLLWNPDDIVRLRTLGNLALNPIGHCTNKLATKGKVGSVPVLLSDEELYTLYYNRWIDYAMDTDVVVDALPLLSSNNIPNRTKENIVLMDIVVPNNYDNQPSAIASSSTSSSSSTASVSSTTLSSWSNYSSRVTFTMVDTYLRRKGEENVNVIYRRNVFYNLWYNHYYCTIGIKFGVTYLAYRNDPTAVHAAYMIIVQPENSGITPLDLLARSRVATTALKICVIVWSTRNPYYLTRTLITNTNTNDGDSITYSPLILPQVHYAAFKRMGPGTAIFADYSAQEEAKKRDESYYYYQNNSNGNNHNEAASTVATDMNTEV